MSSAMAVGRAVTRASRPASRLSTTARLAVSAPRRSPLGGTAGLPARHAQKPFRAQSWRGSSLVVEAAASPSSSADDGKVEAAAIDPEVIAGPLTGHVAGTTEPHPKAAEGGGDGGSGANGGGSGGGGGGGHGGDDEDDDKLLNLSEAEEIVAAKGLKLPADFAAAAQSGGLRSSALNKWVALQAVWLYALISRLTPIFRDRLIADDRFLFKVMAEIVIDSGCATVAEVRKRGDEFWDEFEFYLSDLLVGLVLDVFIISCIAPVAVIGAKHKSASASGFKKITAGFPSAFFEKSTPGVRKFSIGQRFGCLGLTMLQYGGAGALCGFLGQAVANQLMLLKRKVAGPSENDVAIPPAGLTGFTWGVFMAGSSNLRYQTVFGLERLVEMSPIFQYRALTNAVSIAIRYTNNVIGGENFIDHARFFGCQ